jgi:hypothetical protein
MPFLRWPATGGFAGAAVWAAIDGIRYHGTVGCSLER